jgi:hypothetical protein
MCDKKGRVKQKLEVCIDYNNSMGGANLSDQYFTTHSTTRKRIKNTIRKYSDAC